MPNNYNSTLQSNNTDLQAILNTINELPNAGGSDPVLQDKTVTPTTSKQTVTADSGYDGLDTVTVNAMPTATQATPSITINASGLITATATQTAGYVAAGTKSSTKQLAFQAAKTITPTTTNQIAVSSGYYTGGVVTVKGDSNLIAGNIRSGISIFGVNGTYEGSGSGDTSIEDGLITKNITSCTNDRVTSIGSSVFYSCSKLTAVSFLNVKTINHYAFYGCSSLTTANFPMATHIYSRAFGECSALTTINFPKVEYIKEYAFISCKRLITASFPAVTSIGYAAFSSCSMLTTVNLPLASQIAPYAFYDCRKLTAINLPKATAIQSYAYNRCYSLATASLPLVSNIGEGAFSYCYNLKSLYLTNSRVCVLSNSFAFYSTPIGGYSTSAGTYGSIYVPASLLNSYKTATNWTYFSSRFVGI